MALDPGGLGSSLKTRIPDQQTLTFHSQSKVVVCIPAFNEEKSIGHVVQESRNFGDHVFVCDDGSTDNTSLQAASNGAIVIQHETNKGKGAALKSLLERASKLDPAVIVTIDGDGQHDPSEIPLLVSPVLGGDADVVVGCRFNGRNHIPLYRRVGNSVLTLMTNWKAGTHIRDTQSGFRSYSSKVLPHISIDENGMGVDSQILLQVARQGFRIQEQDVSVSYRGATSTFNPLSHILRVTWSLARQSYRGFGKAPRTLWIIIPMALALALLALTFSLISFSWMGFAISTLTIGAGSLAIVLGPSARLIKWFRRAK